MHTLFKFDTHYYYMLNGEDADDSALYVFLQLTWASTHGALLLAAAADVLLVVI